MDPLIGASLINGGFQTLGGIASAITGNSAQRREYQRQKEFAQNAIQWKVADAKKAGLHPLYAIGSSTATYSPQSTVGTDFGLGEMGQGVQRAFEAYANKEERAYNDAVLKKKNQLELERLELENEGQRIQNNKFKVDMLADQVTSSQRALINQPGQPPSFPRISGQSPFAGVVEHKPAQETSSVPSDPASEAGYLRAYKWLRYKNGDVSYWPTQDVQDVVSESLPSQVQWYINGMLEGPPPEYTVDSNQVGWLLNPVLGRYRPLYPDNFDAMRALSPFLVRLIPSRKKLLDNYRKHPVYTNYEKHILGLH